MASNGLVEIARVPERHPRAFRPTRVRGFCCGILETHETFYGLGFEFFRKIRVVKGRYCVFVFNNCKRRLTRNFKNLFGFSLDYKFTFLHMLIKRLALQIFLVSDFLEPLSFSQDILPHLFLERRDSPLHVFIRSANNASRKNRCIFCAIYRNGCYRNSGRHLHHR